MWCGSDASQEPFASVSSWFSETLVPTAQRHIADDAFLIMNLHLTVCSSEMWVPTAQRHIAEHSNLITNTTSTQVLRRTLLCTYSTFSRQRCPKRNFGVYSSAQLDKGKSHSSAEVHTCKILIVFH